jgi:hypothetical protein
MKHKYIILSVLSILIFLIITLNKSNSFFENRYRLVAIEARLITILNDRDSLGCSILSEYSSINKGQIGIAFKLKKQYYSDSTIERGLNTTMAIGIDGTKEKIKKLKVMLFDSLSQKSYEITNLLYGDSTIIGISEESASIDYRKSYPITDNGCVVSPYFGSINNFVNMFNSNNKSLLGSELLTNNESLFLLNKKSIPSDILNNKNLAVRFIYVLDNDNLTP